MTRNKSPYNALVKLLQRFSLRHGFSRRTPHSATVQVYIIFYCYGKLLICFIFNYNLQLPSAELLEIRDNFSSMYWNSYGSYSPNRIYNADETGVCYEMPPTKIWAEKGKSSKIPATKHSARLTALLTVRADGMYYCCVKFFINIYLVLTLVFI